MHRSFKYTVIYACVVCLAASMRIPPQPLSIPNGHESHSFNPKCQDEPCSKPNDFDDYPHTPPGTGGIYIANSIGSISPGSTSSSTSKTVPSEVDDSLFSDDEEENPSGKPVLTTPEQKSERPQRKVRAIPFRLPGSNAIEKNKESAKMKFPPSIFSSFASSDNDSEDNNDESQNPAAEDQKFTAFGHTSTRFLPISGRLSSPPSLVTAYRPHTSTDSNQDTTMTVPIVPHRSGFTFDPSDDGLIDDDNDPYVPYRPIGLYDESFHEDRPGFPNPHAWDTKTTPLEDSMKRHLESADDFPVQVKVHKSQPDFFRVRDVQLPTIYEDKVLDARFEDPWPSSEPEFLNPRSGSF
jgi:hypothetical protein